MGRAVASRANVRRTLVLKKGTFPRAPRQAERLLFRKIAKTKKPEIGVLMGGQGTMEKLSKKNDKKKLQALQKKVSKGRSARGKRHKGGESKLEGGRGNLGKRFQKCFETVGREACVKRTGRGKDPLSWEGGTKNNNRADCREKNRTLIGGGGVGPGGKKLKNSGNLTEGSGAHDVRDQKRKLEQRC